MKKATRVDLVFHNADGDSWVFECASPSEVLQAYFGLPDEPRMTNLERWEASRD